jgi:hypothetical protein
MIVGLIAETYRRYPSSQALRRVSIATCIVPSGESLN